VRARVSIDRWRSYDAVVDAGGRKPDWQLEWEAEHREILAGVTFSVFAPEGLRLELTGWGGGEGKPVDSVALRHELDETRWIVVDSELAEDDFHLPDAKRDAPYHLGGLGGAPAGVATGSRRLSVDGVDVVFAYATAGDRWAAIGAVGDVTITIQACGMSADDIRLRALADPARLVDSALPQYRPRRRQLGVLDSRRVAELADATPIADLGATLAGFARGGFGLLASEGLESSWIGGEPRLPADVGWPGGVHGAMAFVAQLSLADLDPSVWTGPASGHLHVFCDIEPESTSIEGAGACAILHTPAGAALSVLPFPSDLHEYKRIPQQMVTPRVGLTLPDEDAPLMRPLGLGLDGERESEMDELWLLGRRVHAEQGWHDAAGQLLGWPTWQHDDSMEYLASLRDGQALEWTLLLQTDALGPELYVVLPTADLAAARFDRAEATIEHD
jgi:Domain of unknown function (DUF1963)